MTALIEMLPAAVLSKQVVRVRRISLYAFDSAQAGAMPVALKTLPSSGYVGPSSVDTGHAVFPATWARGHSYAAVDLAAGAAFPLSSFNDKFAVLGSWVTTFREAYQTTFYEPRSDPGFVAH